MKARLRRAVRRSASEIVLVNILLGENHDVAEQDLVGGAEAAFAALRDEYTKFLARVGLEPKGFVPISAREGHNLVTRSPAMPWYQGPAVLEVLDAFTRTPAPSARPLRMPLQGVYKFTEQGDDRRIVAGRIETGRAAVGDEVVFLPSGKRSTIAGVESFNTPPRQSAEAGQAAASRIAYCASWPPCPREPRAAVSPQGTSRHSLRVAVVLAVLAVVCATPRPLYKCP